VIEAAVEQLESRLASALVDLMRDGPNVAAERLQRDPSALPELGRAVQQPVIATFEPPLCVTSRTFCNLVDPSPTMLTAVEPIGSERSGLHVRGVDLLPILADEAA
jgi:hypothetical protein